MARITSFQPKQCTRVALEGVLLTCLLAACAGIGPWPEEGTPVHQTYVAQCGHCHNLPHPGRLNADQWDHMLALMVTIMDERKVAYTKDEMQTIRAYLHRNAR